MPVNLHQTQKTRRTDFSKAFEYAYDNVSFSLPRAVKLQRLRRLAAHIPQPPREFRRHARNWRRRLPQVRLGAKDCAGMENLLFSPTPQQSQTKLTTNTQHYELLPQPTLATAEASLRSEIGPFATHLLDRADRQVERQARKIETLKARSDLNAGRLSRGPSPSPEPTQQQQQQKTKKGPIRSSNSRKTLDGGAGLRARAVRQRKEALKYSVERLELEVAQKERELRVRLQDA